MGGFSFMFFYSKGGPLPGPPFCLLSLTGGSKNQPYIITGGGGGGGVPVMNI